MRLTAKEYAEWMTAYRLGEVWLPRSDLHARTESRKCQKTRENTPVTTIEPRKTPPHGRRGDAPTPAMRTEMAWRAADPCVYCGRPAQHWDHMHSRHRGGHNATENLIRACKPCNVNKRTLSPLHYLALRAAGKRL